MEIPVLIEPVAGNGYRVTGTVPFPFSVEGASKEEVLRKVQDLVANRVAQGAEVGSVIIGSVAPWKEFAGHLKDDPWFDAWQAAIAEYRRQRDQEDSEQP